MERQISTRPLKLPRSTRRDEWRGLTSCRAGEVVPIAYFPLLREDSIRGRFMAQIKMEEALHTVINPIRVTMQAHLVPKSALARFDGSMEVLNRSYQGETLPGGGASPPWHILDPAVALAGNDDAGHVIYDKLGIHYRADSRINNDLLESYWTIYNWRSRAISKALPQWVVTKADGFAPAFWNSWKFDHIKPSFDAAMMEGAVPIDVQGEGRVVAYGDVLPGSTPGLPNDTALDLQVGALAGYQHQVAYVSDSDGTAKGLAVEVSEGGAFISLANIELAKKSQAFAKMRERYQGVPDEYLIDLLMQGISVPPEDFREPILIARAQTVIGQTERYATDGASLDQSVTNGVAQLMFTINTPSINPGGIVLITLEIVPEQLAERMGDVGIYMEPNGTAEWLPNALQDFLDPQKVSVVPNKYADVLHSDPDGIFGYGPLNYAWQRNMARVGGRYKRPVPDAFVEDRQRIWTVEQDDPSLTTDFYVCPQPFPHTVFADADADPFEVITVGQMAIRGLTVFGGTFMEDDDHYEKIIAEIDQSRLSGDPAGGGAAGATLTHADGTETGGSGLRQGDEGESQ